MFHDGIFVEASGRPLRHAQQISWGKMNLQSHDYVIIDQSNECYPPAAVLVAGAVKVRRSLLK